MDNDSDTEKNLNSSHAHNYTYKAVPQIIEDRDKYVYQLEIEDQPTNAVCYPSNEADCTYTVDPTPRVYLQIHLPKPVTDNSSADERPHLKRKNDLEREKGSKKTAVEDSKGFEAILKQDDILPHAPLASVSSEDISDLGYGEKMDGYLENPYYLMSATLVATGNGEIECPRLDDSPGLRASRYSSLYRYDHPYGTKRGLFVFPGLKVRNPGCYHVRFCLYETIGNRAYFCTSIDSTPFNISSTPVMHSTRISDN